MTPRSPAKELGGALELTTGRFNRVDGDARLNVPVSDTARFYCSGLSLTRDGYVTRLVDGRKKGNQNNYTGRFVGEWDATPSVNFLLSADYTRTREEAVATSLRQVNENAVFPVFNNIFLNAPACLPPSPVTNPTGSNSSSVTRTPTQTTEVTHHRSTLT